jgi:carbon starvation protein CstA
VVTFILMMIDFEVLWRYFAWCNQTLATFTLWACTVYLARNQKFFWITLVPALFMQVVTVSYILLAPAPEGFALPHTFSFAVAAVSCVITIACFARFMRNLRSRIINR